MAREELHRRAFPLICTSRSLMWTRRLKHQKSFWADEKKTFVTKAFERDKTDAQAQMKVRLECVNRAILEVMHVGLTRGRNNCMIDMEASFALVPGLVKQAVQPVEQSMSDMWMVMHRLSTHPT